MKSLFSSSRFLLIPLASHFDSSCFLSLYSLCLQKIYDRFLIDKYDRKSHKRTQPTSQSEVYHSLPAYGPLRNVHLGCDFVPLPAKLPTSLHILFVRRWPNIIINSISHKVGPISFEKGRERKRERPKE